MLVVGLAGEGAEAFQVPNHSDLVNGWLGVGKAHLFRCLRWKLLFEQLVVSTRDHRSGPQERAQEPEP